MGSSRTFTWQCIALVAIVVVFALVAPVESKFWVMLTGLPAAAFFIVVSLARHQQIKRLAGEIDEVLHNGRRIDFSTSSEGDVAVLTNELQKMVARLARTTEQLEAERNALANSLADISHQIRTPLTAITLMLPSIERAEERDRTQTSSAQARIHDRARFVVGDRALEDREDRCRFDACRIEAFVMRGDYQARDRAARACARLARCEPGGGS